MNMSNVDRHSNTGWDGGRQRDYMAQAETDLLGGLPDFHKMNLSEVDVIERTVTKCAPMGPMKRDEESEECELETEQWEMQNFGMGEEDATGDEETPEMRTLNALDRLLKRIEILQCDIRLRQQLQGNRQSEDQLMMQQHEKELKECHGFARNLAEIRQLQLAQHHMQCQITELLCRYANLRIQKRALMLQWRHVVQKTTEIRAVSEVHQQWMLDTANEIANCRKRSKLIRESKLTKELATEVTETNIWSSFRYSQRYLLRKLVSRHLKDLCCEIKELKQYSDDLKAEIDQRLVNIGEKALKLGRLGSADTPIRQPSILKRDPKYTPVRPGLANEYYRKF